MMLYWVFGARVVIGDNCDGNKTMLCQRMLGGNDFNPEYASSVFDNAQFE